jgi:hypothetical protein
MIQRNISSILAFSFLQSFKRGFGAQSVSYPMGTGGSFLGDVTAISVKLSIHFHRVPTLRMQGTVLALRHTFSWRWYLIKCSDKFNIKFYLLNSFFVRRILSTLHPQWKRSLVIVSNINRCISIRKFIHSCIHRLLYGPLLSPDLFFSRLLDYIFYVLPIYVH